MKPITSIYFVVRVDVEHKPEQSAEEVIDEVQTNCNYMFKYRKNGMHIIDTEICGTNNDDINI